MPFVRYVGDADEVETGPTGVVTRGQVIEVTALEGGSLVGYGDGLWRYVDPEPETPTTPEAVADVPVDATPAEENAE